MVRQKDAKLRERNKGGHPGTPLPHELRGSVCLPACLPRLLCSLMVSVWAPGLTSVGCMAQAPCPLAPWQLASLCATSSLLVSWKQVVGIMVKSLTSGWAPPMGRPPGGGGREGSEAEEFNLLTCCLQSCRRLAMSLHTSYSSCPVASPGGSPSRFPRHGYPVTSPGASPPTADFPTPPHTFASCHAFIKLSSNYSV